jgi:hypothetical protein
MPVEPHPGLRKVGRTVTYVTAGVKEVLTIHRGAASGGTWTLTVDEQETSDINWNAAAGTVETAVEALSSVTAATVTGAGTSGDPWVITIDDPIRKLSTRADGSNLTPSDLLVFVETTPGKTPGELKPAVITALGGGTNVDLRVGHHGETRAGAILMFDRNETDVWYGSSRKHFSFP